MSGAFFVAEGGGCYTSDYVFVYMFQVQLLRVLGDLQRGYVDLNCTVYHFELGSCLGLWSRRRDRLAGVRCGFGVVAL
jgi:hypothetical protein